MKKIKLFKTLLIPSLGVLTLGTIAAVATSCGRGRVSVVSVSLSETKISLNVGDSKRLEAFVNPDTATDKSVTWTSSNETVATVDKNGNVTAVAVGTATITVTTNDGGKTDTCQVTVEPVHVESVTLNESSIVLDAGNTKTLIATVLPENATDKSVTWTSSNINVATIDNGNVTAVAVGTATITVTTNDGGKTATCAVTVEPIHVESVSLDWHKLNIVEGYNDYLIATISPANATDQSVSWVSDNETVATVENGKVTAVSVGTANITVTTEDGGKTDTCQVNVKQKQVVPVTDVQIYPVDVNLKPGQNTTLTATVLPEDATDKLVTWSTNNKSVATVDPNTGEVTAKSSGKAKINVMTHDGFHTATCDVNVQTLYVSIFANADSTLELVNKGENSPNLQYSFDGETWNQYTEQIAIPSGTNLYLKGNNPNGWSTSRATYSNFNITGDVSLSENIMALIDNGKGTATAAIPNNYCFYSLFKDSTGITSVSKDFLPATTLQNCCYDSMFYGCTNLRNAPELPATELAEDCYYSMFNGCTNLRNAPELPATKLANWCYYCMFQGCTSLTQAPDLPATSLAERCYQGMFQECTNLTTAPELPATTLANYCYSFMFRNCDSLTTAPELPATELANSCYSYMFSDCDLLTIAPDLPATDLAVVCYLGMFQDSPCLHSIRLGYAGTVAKAPSGAFTNWVKGVANTGIFYYTGADTKPITDFGFPTGEGKDWLVQPYSR